MGLVLGGMVELARPALSSVVGSRFLCTFFLALLAPGLQWQEVLGSRCRSTKALEFSVSGSQHHSCLCSFCSGLRHDLSGVGAGG